jgi:hypothetical protein
MLWFNVTDSGAPVASSAVEYRVVTCPGGDERFASARRQMDATPRMFEVRYAPCPSDGVKLTVDSPDHFVETVATTIENAEASVLEVALRRSSTIRGVLTGRDTRKVVTPLTIELLRADANGRNASIEREDHATHSDPGSSFAEYHLTPGRYRIDVRPGPYSGMHSFEVVVKELGVQEVRQAIPTFGALEGSVAWEREPEDVMVRVTIQRGDEPAVSKELRLQGSFALERLEPGKYIVAAEARKKNGAVWRDSKNVHVRRQQTSSVALHLTPR